MALAELDPQSSGLLSGIIDPLVDFGSAGPYATLAITAYIGVWYIAHRRGIAVLDRLLGSVGPAVGVLWLQVVYFPMNEGVFLFGVLLGLLGALLAVGMALIYRANRILNFAQSELGLVPTVLAVDLIVYSSINYFVSFFLGLAAAIALGALVELAIIRRFFKAPRLILTVATIGLSQLLLVGSILVPRLWGKVPKSETLETGLGWQFELAGWTYHSAAIIAMVVAPLALIGVAVFLRYTNAGIGIRASAERSDRASLLGVPVKRLQTLVWVLATVLSFIGVFLRVSIMTLPLVSTPSFVALLTAMAALMLGRMTNLAAIATSAVALGILEQGVIWNHGDSPELFQPLLAGIILVVLLVRHTGQSRTEHDSVSSWQAADEIRPVPRELTKVPEVRLVRWGVAVAGIVFLLTLPLWLAPSNEFKAAAVIVFGIIGMSVVVLTGWAGQVSLGQMSFVAVGAALGAVATKTWNIDLLLGLVIAGLAGALVAVIVGLPALRLRGLFLAVTTLAFAVTTSSFFLNQKHFSWIPKGPVARKPLLGSFDLESQAHYYYFVLVIAALCLAALRGIRRSRTGRVLLAQRENERAAQAFGVSVVRAKLVAFALSGFMAAIAGGLYIHLVGSFSETPYRPEASFAVFTSTVVGGLGALSGGFIGSVYFNGGTWYLDGLWTLLPSALGVLFVLMVLRGGIGGLVFQVRDIWLRSVGARKGIIVPSLLADVRTEDENAVLTHAEESVEEHDPGPDPPRAGADVPPAETQEPPDDPAAIPAGDDR